MKMSKAIQLSFLTAVAATITSGCSSCSGNTSPGEVQETADDIRRCINKDMVVVSDDQCDHQDGDAGTSDAGVQEQIAPCAHDGCSTGIALIPQCDPLVHAVCERDPSCCENEWDEFCVSDVEEATCNWTGTGTGPSRINTTTTRTAYMHHTTFFWYYGGGGGYSVGSRVSGGSIYAHPTRVYSSPMRGGVIVSRGGVPVTKSVGAPATKGGSGVPASRGGGFGATGKSSPGAGA